MEGLDEHLDRPALIQGAFGSLFRNPECLPTSSIGSIKPV